MNPTVRRTLLAELISPDEASALLAQARTLQRGAPAGTELKGKNLALLCEAASDADALLFSRAANELGAQVALIRPSLSKLSIPLEVEHTGRMLGRLYDAVECQGMTSTLVQQVRDVAGVPVYDGAATASHPTARLAEQLDCSATAAADNRRFVLQALLLSTIG